MNISFTGENLIQDVYLHWMHRGLHLGCLSMVDECLFHMRGLCFGTSTLHSLATQLNDKMIKVLNFSMLVAKPRRGRFNTIQNRACCKHECRAPCFEQEIWAPINSNSRGLLPVATRHLQGSSSSFCQLCPAAISRNCFLELDPVRDSVFVAYWLICWKKHTPWHTFYCAHSITKQFILFFLLLPLLLKTCLWNLLQCICP